MRTSAHVLVATMMLATQAIAWDVADDGSTRALPNNQEPGNYKVKWTSGDTSLRVKVTSSSGAQLSDDPLPTSMDGITVGVPLGATVSVYDPDDGDILDGHGTIAPA